MINYIAKSESLTYHIYVSDQWLPNGTEVIIGGERCVIISNKGKL